MRKVLGTGGYGCAISPAIVFHNSLQITEANKEKYITKIASDAAEEYDLAKTIEEILGTDKHIGVFPVDNLQCGISKANIGPYYEEVVKKCSQIKSMQSETSLTRKGYYTYRLTGGLQELCALQYPRYQSDLTFFYKPNGLPYEFSYLIVPKLVEKVVKQLMDRYTRLHSPHEYNGKTYHIYHLDTKAQNMCFYNLVKKAYSGKFYKSLDEIDVRIADWGFALFVSETDMESIQRTMNVLKNSKYFFKGIANVDIMFEGYSIKDSLYNTVQNITLMTQDDLRYAYPLCCKVLEVFDNLCMLRVCRLIITNYHSHPFSEQISYDVHQYVRNSFRELLKATRDFDNRSSQSSPRSPPRSPSRSLSRSPSRSPSRRSPKRYVVRHVPDSPKTSSSPSSPKRQKSPSPQEKQGCVIQ
jgi:hypothetical protein